MVADDLLETLEHDHAELNRGVLEVVPAVAALDRGPRDPSIGIRLADRLEALRDDLVMHFVHEEEALFPYLSATVPTLAPAISDLLALHDEICATVARLVHLAESPARIAGLVPVFNRFQAAYTEHVHAEQMLFEQAATHLTRDQRLALAALVRGL